MDVKTIHATPVMPRTGVLDFTAPGCWAYMDIAHSESWSRELMSRDVVSACEWLVAYWARAAAAGVTVLFVKHPYRWRPEPVESIRFGGDLPERRDALHVAMHAARRAGTLFPKLGCYQSLPEVAPGINGRAGEIRQLLASQLYAWDFDGWDSSVGARPWQRTLIDLRGRERTQVLEPVWDVAYPDQFGHPCFVTERALITGSASWAWNVAGLGCWMTRSPGDGASRQLWRDVAVAFGSWCEIRAPIAKRPLYPAHLFVELGIKASEIVGVGA